jgi:hypothetical protein
MSERANASRSGASTAAAIEPHNESPDRLRQLAMQRRAKERRASSELARACEADPVAKQKLEDVTNETAPQAKAKVPAFIEGASDKLQTTYEGRPLEAMRAELLEKGSEYLCLGAPVPPDELVGAGGVARLLDLPSLYRNHYLKPEVADKFVNQKDFVESAAEGEFNPDSDLDNQAKLRGRAEESWWYPLNEGGAVDLEKLRRQLYIQDDPSYAAGAVRLTATPQDCADKGLELCKPTAFDGLMQGWNQDPWWRPSDDPHWGLTKNNAREAVMKMMELGTFTHRELILPTKKEEPPK